MKLDLKNIEDYEIFENEFGDLKIRYKTNRGWTDYEFVPLEVINCPKEESQLKAAWMYLASKDSHEGLNAFKKCDLFERK